MSSRDEDSELSLCAAALEAELVRFEDAAVEVKGLKLDSRKNLDRSIRALNRAAEIEGRLAEKVNALIAAIRAANGRQQAAADTITAFGREIADRQQAYAKMVEAFEGLAKDASAVTELAAAGPSALSEIRVRVGELVERAEALRVEAEAGGIKDLARDAEGRHGQLAAALAKLDKVAPDEDYH